MPADIPTDPQSARQRAARIIKHPDNYKVCCGCDSILSRVVGICPRCSAYRYDSSPETVRATARAIIARRKSSTHLPETL
jgi:uncharacterized paraquat-inducible protein A